MSYLWWGHSRPRRPLAIAGFKDSIKMIHTIMEIFLSEKIHLEERFVPWAWKW